MAEKLCTDKNEDHDSIESVVACRLIPLSKDPGVKPIGIGEVLRRIIGKAVTSIIEEDKVLSADNLQLCGGQKSGASHAAPFSKVIHFGWPRDQIKSTEGSTQGDPTAMAMYAISIQPLLETNQNKLC